VAVGLKNPSDAKPLCEVQKTIVFVRRVDEDGLTGRSASKDKDVVVNRPDNQFVDLKIGISVMECVGHLSSVAQMLASGLMFRNTSLPKGSIPASVGVVITFRSSETGAGHRSA
jgi:hypothetical protein